MNVFRASHCLCFPCPLKGKSTRNWFKGETKLSDNFHKKSDANIFRSMLLKDHGHRVLWALFHKTNAMPRLRTWIRILVLKVVVGHIEASMKFCNTHFCRIDLQRSSVVPLTLAFKRLFPNPNIQHASRASCRLNAKYFA